MSAAVSNVLLNFSTFQRRKIKEKNPMSQKPPMFEFSTLRTKTVRVLMVVCFLASFAIHTPFIFIVSSFSGLGVISGSIRFFYAINRNDCGFPAA